MTEKPTPPGNNECCESGCNPCVWDLYYEELQEWKDAQATTTATAQDKKESKQSS